MQCYSVTQVCHRWGILKNLGSEVNRLPCLTLNFSFQVLLKKAGTTVS